MKKIVVLIGVCVFLSVSLISGVLYAREWMAWRISRRRRPFLSRRGSTCFIGGYFGFPYYYPYGYYRYPYPDPLPYNPDVYTETVPPGTEAPQQITGTTAIDSKNVLSVT